MSGEIEVTQLVETIEVKAGDTVEVTQQLSTIEVVDGDTIEVTETQEIVELKAADVIEVAEEIISVAIGGADHPATHPLTGSEHTLSGLTLGDVLTATAPDAAAFQAPTGGGAGTHALLPDVTPNQHHAQAHAIDGADHTGAISAAQHGSPAGDLHTLHAYLPGRAGAANDLTLSTTIQGIITGSAASGQKLSLRGTTHATPGLVEVQRATGTAAVMFQGLIGAEANPRWAFTFDTTGLVGLGFGSGATAMDVFWRRTGLRALRLISNHVSLLPTLGARDSNDTADSWTLDRQLLGGGTPTNRGRLLFGGDGTTAPDAGFRRGSNPGEVRVMNYLLIPNMVTAPSPALLPADEEPESPLYLYAASGGVSGIKPSLFYKADDSQGQSEVGPLGTVRGLHRRTDLAIGGFAVNNADGAGIEGVNFWGLLAGPTASGSSSSNVAYSPARSLTNAINATETFFGITGGVVPTGDVIVIDSEKIQVVQTSIGPDSVATLRGAYGTTAAAHAAGAPILFSGGANRTLFGSDGEAAFEQTTGTTINTNAGLVWPYNHCYHSEPLQIYKFDLRHVTDLRFFCGFTDAGGPLVTDAENIMLGSDNPAGNYWGIQFSTARGDTEFQAVAKDGMTQNLQATGWGAPLANTKYYVVLEKQGGADPTVSLFNLSWAPVGSPVTLTTNLPPPDMARQRLLCSIRNLAGADKRIRHFHGTFVPSPSVT